SLDEPHSDLDYALIEAKDPDHQMANVLKHFTVHDEDLPMEIDHIIKLGQEDKEIVAISVRGPVPGRMSGTPVYARAPGSRVFEELYSVQLSGPVEVGDSGAWILDRESQSWCGYIVAGSPGSGAALVVPSYHLFEDIERRMGIRPSLPSSSSKEVMESHELLENVDITTPPLSRLKDSTQEQDKDPRAHISSHGLSSGNALTPSAGSVTDGSRVHYDYIDPQITDANTSACLNARVNVTAFGDRSRRDADIASRGWYATISIRFLRRPREDRAMLIDNGADVNAQGGVYGNALQAASIGFAKIVQILLDNGADVNAQGGHLVMLSCASFERHERSCRYCSTMVRTLMRKAARMPREIVQILVDKVRTSMRKAATMAMLSKPLPIEAAKIVQILLDKGADINAQGGHYGNALQAASYTGYEEIVQILVDNGADVNAQGGQNGNALCAASNRGCEKIVQILLDNGADVNAQGGQNGNALYAASYRRYEKIVQILVDNGADVNAQGGDYGNALCAASYTGYEEIVQILVDNGADVNAQGGYYGNALCAASYKGYKEIVQILVDNGADVNAQGGYYGNALQAASFEGHEEIVQILVDNGADVNAQGGVYGNALYAASERGHEEIVQILLDNGADINAKGGVYGNALQAASDRGFAKIVQILRKTGKRDHEEDHGESTFKRIKAK
ncbi:ankyrin repeat-containing domain protein, partial [Thelonectria olida]